MEIDIALKTAILGFGNPVRSDDGAGNYVINELQKKLLYREDVSLFDMGTSAFEVLFKLSGHSKIIIVDSVINSNEPDGTLFCLPAEEINAQINEDPLVFLHGMKWDQALSYAKKIMVEDFPENNIKVYLISISDIRMNMQLSAIVKDAADKLVEAILKEI